MLSKSEKIEYLKQLGTPEESISKILAYCKNQFISQSVYAGVSAEKELKNKSVRVQVPSQTPEYLHANFSSISTWESYVEESKVNGVFSTLQKYLISFQFPVASGISKTENYRKATLAGKSTTVFPEASGLVLQEPEHIRLEIHNGVAGKVPVLIVPNTEDFKQVVRALAHKNEPVALPDSMGAVFIKGLNNWDRIHQLKHEFLTKNNALDWSTAFKNTIIPQKELYQDQLIVLSKKPYSNVPSEDMELSEQEWLDSSLKIRLYHECAHQFTVVNYNHIAKNLHDELIADYAGITGVLKNFNATWFLKFMGLENYPVYREGGRFENYMDDEDNATFKIVQIILKKTAGNLEVFDKKIGKIDNISEQIKRLKCICETDLLTLSSDIGVLALIEKYNRETNVTEA
ncbi:hypothetical protein NBT05_06760 [Aquimarina sp. ERC-38]|uniref:DUF7005 family protein n=1 Tax=Aquimarina sp. ERC-38 TaxID=2949996 RepID=UPI002247B241|nr:hypothetical protein [Aquimarina sp. ERC-38]UZO82168.1 hypothetical protein NBT05_06760 [Aquimarina sp. ERC-38]